MIFYATNSRLEELGSRTRTLAKALTWLITATLMTACISFIVAREIGIAVMIGSIEFIIKFFIYYGHERAWNLFC